MSGGARYGAVSGVKGESEGDRPRRRTLRPYLPRGALESREDVGAGTATIGTLRIPAASSARRECRHERRRSAECRSPAASSTFGQRRARARRGPQTRVERCRPDARSRCGKRRQERATGILRAGDAISVDSPERGGGAAGDRIHGLLSPLTNRAAGDGAKDGHRITDGRAPVASRPSNSFGLTTASVGRNGAAAGVEPTQPGVPDLNGFEDSPWATGPVAARGQHSSEGHAPSPGRRASTPDVDDATSEASRRTNALEEQLRCRRATTPRGPEVEEEGEIDDCRRPHYASRGRSAKNAAMG